MFRTILAYIKTVIFMSYRNKEDFRPMRKIPESILAEVPALQRGLLRGINLSK